MEQAACRMMSHFLPESPCESPCTKRTPQRGKSPAISCILSSCAAGTIASSYAPRRRDHRGVPNVLSLVQYDNQTQRVNDPYVNSTLLWLGSATKRRAAYTVVGIARA